MTPQELIDAVRPCLPLPGITRFEHRGDRLIDLDHKLLVDLDFASRLVIGAIAQACAERGWWVAQQSNRVEIWNPAADTYHDFDGTDALAWCRAYAQAKEATK
jgi:hypothetical protein